MERTSTTMVLIVLTIVLPAAQADADFISNTCKKTKNAGTCVAMLSANPKSAYATTEHDLANITLQITIDTVYNDTAVMGELAQDFKGSPEGGAFAVCFRIYLDANNDLKFQARHAFDYKDYVGASKLVLLAKGAGDACENAFKAIKKKSLLTDIDCQMTEHCGVTADL